MKTLDRLLESVLVLLMIGLVFDVVWQVFARYVLQNPSSFTDELARYLLIWVGYLGAAYGTGKKVHLAIDILASKLTTRRLGVLHRNSVALLIISFAFLVLVIGGGRLVYITVILEQSSSALGVPLGLVYSVIPLSGMLIITYCMNEIFESRVEMN